MLGIVYDSTIIYKKDDNYYSDNFSGSVVDRYYGIDNELMYIMPFEYKDDCSEYEVIGYKIHEGVIKKTGFSFRVLRDYLYNKKKLEEYIKMCDKLIIRMPSVIGISAIKMANMYNKKYLVELVGDIRSSLWYHGFRGKMLSAFFYLKVKKTILNSKNVQYITKTFLQRLYPTNGRKFVCPNTAFKRKKNLIKEYKNIDNKNISLATIGNVNVRYKGQSVVLNAVKLLKDKGYNIKYYLIGGGNQLYLKKIIKKLDLENEVILLGQLPHIKVNEYLYQTDIYIQPSFSEAQGRSLLEAMNVGCPCLCTNVGGMRELIEPKYRFKAGDYRKLVGIISDIDSLEIKKMGYRNWKYANEYSDDVCSEIRNRIYNEVFGGN